MVCVVIQTLKSLSTYTAIYGSNNKAEMKGSLSKPPQSTDCNAHSLLRVICILVKIFGYKNYLSTTKHCADLTECGPNLCSTCMPVPVYTASNIDMYWYKRL